MPNLLIRDMPEHVYEQLKKRAERDRRSVPAENIHLLEQFFQQDKAKEKHRQAMRSIIERAREKGPVSIDSTEIIREDRER